MTTIVTETPKCSGDLSFVLYNACEILLPLLVTMCTQKLSILCLIYLSILKQPSSPRTILFMDLDPIFNIYLRYWL